MKFFMLACIFIIGCVDDKQHVQRNTKKLGTVESPIISGDFSVLKETHLPCITRQHPLQGVRHTDFFDRFGNVTQHTKTLTECTLINNKKSRCTFNELDFFFQGKAPTTDDILAKTLVTTTWMAHNFEALLRQMPAIVFNLFSSVTAVIIHPYIHASVFFPATGALYISPQFLALTDAQQDEIHVAQQNKNFCSSNNTLNAHYISRYINDHGIMFFDMIFPERNSWAIPLADNADGAKDKITFYALASLLFHELAHANDFYPIEHLSSRSLDETPDYLRMTDHGIISMALYEKFPLVDTTGLLSQSNLDRYAQAPFDIALIADVFIKSSANDIYSFFGNTEDTALLFEELMMKHHFNIDREVAFIASVAPDKQRCKNTLFYQAARNRHLSPDILPRALFVAERLDPQFDANQYQQKHGKPAPFSWCRKNE